MQVQAANQPTRPDLRRHLWLAVALLVGASALFLHHVADVSMWEDEAWTIHAAQQPTLPAVMEFVQEDSFPPLYFFLLHGWQAVAGDALIGYRLVNVWAALVGTALTYRLALDTAGRWTAVAAVAILITSDIVLAFVPFARQYPFFLLLAALASWCYWRFTRRWSWPWAAAYILAAVLLLYTIYWGGFVLIAHGLHALIYHRDRLPRLVLVLLAVTLLFAPGLPLLLDQATGSSLGVSEEGGYVHYIPADRNGLSVIIFQLFGVPETLFLGLALAGLVGTWTAAARWQDRLPTPGTALAGLWLSVPIVLPVLMTLAGYKLLAYRPMVGLVPALAVLIGYGLGQMPRWVYGVLLAIILVNNHVTTGARMPVHGPWWETTTVLKTYMSPDDALYIESDLWTYTFEQHARQADVPYAAIVRGGPVRLGWAGESDKPVVDRVAEYDSLWLVEYFEMIDARPDLAALGFVPTTPVLDFGQLMNKSIRLTRFARVPDDPLPWTFGSELQLAVVDWWQSKDTLHVDMTWQALAPPALDYTVVTFLMGPDGRLVTQQDSYPLDGRALTTTWAADSWHFDRHNLDLRQVPPGDYRLAVRVYTWWDMVIQPVTPCDETLCEHIFVGTIHIPST